MKKNKDTQSYLIRGEDLEQDIQMLSKSLAFDTLMATLLVLLGIALYIWG